MCGPGGASPITSLVRASSEQLVLVTAAARYPSYPLRSSFRLPPHSSSLVEQLCVHELPSLAPLHHTAACSHVAPRVSEVELAYCSSTHRYVPRCAVYHRPALSCSVQLAEAFSRYSAPRTTSREATVRYGTPVPSNGPQRVHRASRAPCCVPSLYARLVCPSAAPRT